MTGALAPGAYLRLRREAAGLSLDDVAFAMETIPTVSARSRAEWLGQIEAGLAPLQVDVLLALEAHPMLMFDRDVLLALSALAAGLTAFVPAICGACGCTEYDPCVTDEEGCCAWADAAATICTRCAHAVAV